MSRAHRGVCPRVRTTGLREVEHIHLRSYDATKEADRPEAPSRDLKCVQEKLIEEQVDVVAVGSAAQPCLDHEAPARERRGRAEGPLGDAEVPKVGGNQDWLRDEKLAAREVERGASAVPNAVRVAYPGVARVEDCREG